jgi:hypothetical protein
MRKYRVYTQQGDTLKYIMTIDANTAHHALLVAKRKAIKAPIIGEEDDERHREEIRAQYPRSISNGARPVVGGARR